MEQAAVVSRVIPQAGGRATRPDRTQRQAAAPRIGKVAPGSCLPAGRHRKGCQVAGRLPSRAEPARVRVRTPAAALRLSYRTCAARLLLAYSSNRARLASGHGRHVRPTDWGWLARRAGGG
jgi:hypothetical protein